MRVFPSLPLTRTSFSTKARHTLRRAFFVYGGSVRVVGGDTSPLASAQ